MKRATALVVVLLALGLSLSAQNLGELFQKAKEQVKALKWTEALSTLDALDAASKQPGAETQRKQLEPVLAFYRGVCFANLDRAAESQSQFQTYLSASPNASLDRGMYSKKTVDAFEAARTTIARQGELPAALPPPAPANRDLRIAQPSMRVVAFQGGLAQQTDFRSPMILEMPFLLSEPAKWNGKWTAEGDYAEQGKYRCEGVFIESLLLRASRISQTVVAVTIKTKLRNRGDHDKRVDLKFELETDGTRVSEAALPRSYAEVTFESNRNLSGMFPPLVDGIKVEESDSATKVTKLGFMAAEIGPSTRMKITMSLKNE